MSEKRKVHLVDQYLIPSKWRWNVAVYCRVSTLHDDQAQSLANQISYYKNLIQHHLECVLVDIYADVQSGKSIAKRTEFQRMLEDCRNRKIDLIITKSISRFGRNTTETLDLIHKLHLLNVDIFFETENIYTHETSKSLLLSLLQVAAQAESESRSQNIKWGIKRGLETGKSKFYNRKCFGYQHDEEGNLIIAVEEAEIVKKIFNLYLSGYSIITMIRELEKEGIKSPTGRERWSKRTIDTMLCNEKYIGNALVGKTYSLAFPSNDRRVKNGERGKYLATQNHLPIISQEQFELVQAEKEKRSNIQIKDKKIERKNTHYSMKKNTLNASYEK